MLDFDVSNKSISDFRLHQWRQIIFFTVLLSSQKQSEEFPLRNQIIRINGTHEVAVFAWRH